MSKTLSLIFLSVFLTVSLGAQTSRLRVNKSLEENDVQKALFAGELELYQSFRNLLSESSESMSMSMSMQMQNTASSDPTVAPTTTENATAVPAVLPTPISNETATGNATSEESIIVSFGNFTFVFTNTTSTPENASDANGSEEQALRRQRSVDNADATGGDWFVGMIGLGLGLAGLMAVVTYKKRKSRKVANKDGQNVDEKSNEDKNLMAERGN